MTIKEIRNKTGLSQSEFSLVTGVPTATLRNWEQNRRECPEYVKSLIIDRLIMKKYMKYEDLYMDNFYVFRSHIHHKIKESELKTILYIIENDLIPYYWKAGKPLLSLYLLATLDYLSLRNNVDFVEEYDFFRKQTLEKPFYVKDPLFIKSEQEEIERSLYPFVKYNIMEGNLYDAV